jgi:hypothetical protein
MRWVVGGVNRDAPHKKRTITDWIYTNRSMLVEVLHSWESIRKKRLNFVMCFFCPTTMVSDAATRAVYAAGGY